MSDTLRPRRSVLYMPGANERALEKAKGIPADALILDLEDAVAPDAKAAARDRVCAAVRSGEYGAKELTIRVNGLGTEWHEADLAAAAAAGPDGIVVPKVNSANEVARLVDALEAAGAPAHTSLWAMLETPVAVLNAAEIATASARLTVLIMGTNDLAKELHAEHVPGRGSRRGHRQRPHGGEHARGRSPSDPGGGRRHRRPPLTTQRPAPVGSPTAGRARRRSGRMARTRTFAAIAGGLALALSSMACTSTSTSGPATGVTADATTTTLAGGSGPAVRVPTNTSGDLARLFGAWALGQGADGYVGPCAEDPAAMASATTWCSTEATPAADGQVFVMRHPGEAEPYGAVLIAPSDGFYRIDDSFTFGDGTPPAWAPETSTAS
jgi:hypothetical protein